MFGREGRPTPLGTAFAEDGRIARTLHLLRVVDPAGDTCRRQMNRQLTGQEPEHDVLDEDDDGGQERVSEAGRARPVTGVQVSLRRQNFA